MSVIQAINTGAAQRRTIIDIARDLGPVIAQRASETMDEDQFVAENFALLKSVRAAGSRRARGAWRRRR